MFADHNWPEQGTCMRRRVISGQLRSGTSAWTATSASWHGIQVCDILSSIYGDFQSNDVVLCHDFGHHCAQIR